MARTHILLSVRRLGGRLVLLVRSGNLAQALALRLGNRLVLLDVALGALKLGLNRAKLVAAGTRRSAQP